MLTTKDRSTRTRLCAAIAACLLAGCASTSHQAPVEERVGMSRTPAINGATPAVPADPNKPAEAPKPGIENAGKTGYYTVKQGDTLIRIGLENGQNWKGLVKWNELPNANVIEVGQVLRVVPPGIDPNAAGTKPVTSAKVETRPLGVPTAASGAASGVPAVATAATPAATTSAGTGARENEDDINWMWPANGPVANSFDDTRRKGLALTGKPGDPGAAPADGRGVYSGSGV